MSIQMWKKNVVLSNLIWKTHNRPSLVSAGSFKGTNNGDSPHIEKSVWMFAWTVSGQSLKIVEWRHPEIQDRTSRAVSGWLGPQHSHLLFLSWSLYLEGKQLSVFRPTGPEASCCFQMPRARCTPTLLSHSLSWSSNVIGFIINSSELLKMHFLRLHLQRLDSVQVGQELCILKNHTSTPCFSFL